MLHTVLHRNEDVLISQSVIEGGNFAKLLFRRRDQKPSVVTTVVGDYSTSLRPRLAPEALIAPVLLFNLLLYNPLLKPLALNPDKTSVSNNFQRTKRTRKPGTIM